MLRLATRVRQPLRAELGVGAHPTEWFLLLCVSGVVRSGL